MAPYLPLDAGTVDDPRDYVGRPSVSPALAALVAAGDVAPHHRVLDLGCGRGTDLLTLAQLGFRNLEGIDRNRASLRAARASERRKLKRSVVSWHWGDLGILRDMPAARFDWAYDTFLTNNLREDALPEYFRRVARVLKPGGRLLVQTKVAPRGWSDADRPRSRLFRAGPSVVTHFAEGAWRGGRSHEAVMVTVLAKR